MPIRRIVLARVLGISAVFLGAFSAGGASNLDGCPGPANIFEGITYGCERLAPTAEGSGFLHWARIDLSAPGIELYVTPLNPAALLEGWQYRLRWTTDVVRRERLAVAINGTLFVSNSTWGLRLPGDLARSVETVVADHVVSHIWEHTYLLWFDDRLVPHVEASKPPRASDLNSAKWGIGGQAVWLRDGKVWPGSDRTPNSRTAIAIDRQSKLLYLAVTENISPRRMLQRLADLGAMDGMLLDGGGSSSMAFGRDASGVLAGTVYGGWRPMATHFGVRAETLRAGE